MTNVEFKRGESSWRVDVDALQVHVVSARTADESRKLLSDIFNAEHNPQLCEVYAGGGQCTSLKIEAKLGLWGNRTDVDGYESLCVAARIIHGSAISDAETLDVAFGLHNIGYSKQCIGHGGLLALVRSSQILESSGAVWSDATQGSEVLSNRVAELLRGPLSNCTLPDANIRAVIYTHGLDNKFSPPFMQQLGFEYYVPEDRFAGRDGTEYVVVANESKSFALYGRYSTNTTDPEVLHEGVRPVQFMAMSVGDSAHGLCTPDLGGEYASALIHP